MYKILHCCVKIHVKTDWLLSIIVFREKCLFFYVLLTVYPCIIFFKWSQRDSHYFLVYLYQLLHMFRATVCPSSGELTVSIRHWYFSLCMGGCLVCWLGWDCAVSSQPADQTATHTEWKIPVSYRYSKFSWWWTHSCPKHVEKYEINILRSSVHLVVFIWKRSVYLWTEHCLKFRITDRHATTSATRSTANRPALRNVFSLGYKDESSRVSDNRAIKLGCFPLEDDSVMIFRNFRERLA